MNSLLSIPGFSAAGVACGIKKSGAPDLAVLVADAPCAVAGVFTRNIVQAPPLQISRKVVEGGSCRAIVINSGNANAYTGAEGLENARRMARQVAETLGASADQVAVASTGVIGQQLPMDVVSRGIASALGQLSPTGWEAAAEAIRTTDLAAKYHSATATIGGATVRVTGIAKGSGMIHPNMATMLGFVATDANIAPAALGSALTQAVDRTFNRITVDGDTSTNDCVLALANGRAGNAPLQTDSPEWKAFTELLEQVCAVLARKIVADGEGANHLVTVRVTGARSEADAVTIARGIATSSLVKTAMFGKDPNWGRILAAAGASGALFNPEIVSLTFDDVLLVERGRWLGREAEAQVAKVMAQKEYTITLDLGMGAGFAHYWTCDFSYDYVRINADYRS